MSEMTEIEPPGNPADAALLSLCSELVDSIAAARYLDLAARIPPPVPEPPDWRDLPLTPMQQAMAESHNPGYARLKGIPPDRPGAKRYCDYCGSASAELAPGDQGGTLVCRDSRQCEARKSARWPPRPDLVPPEILKMVGQGDYAQAVRRLADWHQAHGNDDVPDRQQPAPGQQQELATPAGWQAVPGAGAYNTKGDFLPALPQWNQLSHLISGGAHMGHTIAGGAHMGHAPSPVSGAASRAPGAPFRARRSRLPASLASPLRASRPASLRRCTASTRRPTCR